MYEGEWCLYLSVRTCLCMSSLHKCHASTFLCVCKCAHITDLSIKVQAQVSFFLWQLLSIPIWEGHMESSKKTWESSCEVDLKWPIFSGKNTLNLTYPAFDLDYGGGDKAVLNIFPHDFKYLFSSNMLQLLGWNSDSIKASLIWSYDVPHTIHVWYIYLHSVDCS